MMETLSLAAATTLAKIVLDKFFDGAGQKLEDTATKLGGAVVEQANTKIMALGQLVWQRCFSGKPDVDKRLTAATKGSQPDIKVLEDYLGKELDQELKAGGDFAEQVKVLAGEIYQVVLTMNDMNAENVQQNFGGQNQQINNAQAPVIQAKDSPINITYNNG